MATSKKSNSVDPVLAELHAIKRLLMVFSVQAGLSQVDLAKVVGVDEGTLSKTLKGTGKKGSASGQSSKEEVD